MPPFFLGSRSLWLHVFGVFVGSFSVTRSQIWKATQRTLANSNRAHIFNLRRYNNFANDAQRTENMPRIYYAVDGAAKLNDISFFCGISFCVVNFYDINTVIMTNGINYGILAILCSWKTNNNMKAISSIKNLISSPINFYFKHIIFKLNLWSAQNCSA